MARILVADDEASVRTFMAEALELSGHEVVEASNGLDAIASVKKSAYDVLLTDLRMPGADGLAVLRAVRELQPELQVILLTAHGSIESAIQAMKEGAFDYLQKPLSGPAELRLLVERAAEHRLLKQGRALAQLELSSASKTLTFGAAAMVPVIKALERVAPTPMTVLLLGESGTGKEVAARTIHQLSPRRDNPFVVINCAAVSESLVESELFGHEKGAFTGATERRRGRLEMADTGTFFLDEIGELKPGLQAKLLRVLEERMFERVGGSQTIKVDVRWVAATNRDLTTMIADGTFREDLYHRLAVFPIQLPPLRERREDVLPLARMLLERIGPELGRPGLSLSNEAAALIQAAPWTGNVRELKNALERAALMSDGNVITAKDLSIRAAAGGKAAVGEVLMLRDLERQAIERALELAQGNRREAAEKLGIAVRTLYDKIKLYNLE
ncbi:MAG: sigma-54 dependent transcriptional regulator [Myxococcota bacterium]